MIDDWTPRVPSPLRITGLENGVLVETHWAPFKTEDFDRFATDNDDNSILLIEREALLLARWLKDPLRRIELQCGAFGAVESMSFQRTESAIRVDIKQGDSWSEMVQLDLDEVESLRAWLIAWSERT